ncbi:hypothetical protein N0V95_002835 [Ascochyta clinopodiicola]|nr:hypothetical protein N0V95_002835 [Ascochyta clinopodiicola]
MGAARLTPPQPKTTAVTSKRKRELKKTQTSLSRCLSKSLDTPSIGKKRRRGSKTRHKPLGPDAQPGARKHLPIMIDGDDEISGDEVVEQSLLRSANEQHLFEERLCSVELSPRALSNNNLAPQKQSKPTKSSSAQRQIQKERSPVVHLRSQQGSNVSNALVPTRNRTDFTHHDQTLSSVAPSLADDRIELTLADVSDFDLRAKTAQLMAVAPGIPVADLYNLLHEKKGSFEAAKRALLNASRLPRKTPSLIPAAPTRATTVPLTRLGASEDDDRDEPYIKMDLDDPAFMWDNDVPATPPPEPRGRKQNSQGRLKELTAKFFTKAPAGAWHSKHSATFPSKKFGHQIADSTKNACKGSIANKMKGKGAGDINRGMRETSYDRGFIVPDEEMVEESDITYSGSDDDTTSDTDITDDGTDLSIDMEPEYAFNADILSSSGFG